MRHAVNAFVLRHEVAWQLTIGALALAFVAVGFAAEDAGPPPCRVRVWSPTKRRRWLV